ncbi:MAG: hypothetical protein P0S96_01100 [Simkaniaceae bacterium]|nr:hypothetical protein [Candidatus Sacchlamyda saccharinae]
MTVRALTTSFTNTLKGTFIPAALVAAGKGIPKFTQAHTASFDAFQGYGNKFFTTGKTAYDRFTNLTVTQLPELAQTVPSLAQKAWEKGSTQMTVAAVWGGTATLTNEVLKRVPGIRNQATLRAAVSIFVGASAAAATCEFGLDIKPDPHMFADTAIKVATIALPYMAVTTTVDTALGFTGASSSALATIITSACKVGQTAVRALSLPGAPRLINVPGASDTSNADPKAQAALALSMQAQMTAASRATSSTTEKDLTAALKGAHLELTDALAKAIAKGALLNVKAAASTAKSSPDRSRRKTSAKKVKAAAAAAAEAKAKAETAAAGAAAAPPASDQGDASNSSGRSGSGGDHLSSSGDEA